MKDINIINKLVARELNKSEELVDAINSFFWKDVRRKLSSFEHTSVAIKHLGTITTSKRKVDYFIRKTIWKIRNIRKSTRYKESTIALLLETNYDRLRKALKQRNILATQYHENYAKRINRIRKAPSGGNAECGQDSGGDVKPSEAGVQYSPGGGTTGDYETQVNMCSMPV